jgi:hypothetical protein
MKFHATIAAFLSIESPYLHCTGYNLVEQATLNRLVKGSSPSGAQKNRPGSGLFFVVIGSLNRSLVKQKSLIQYEGLLPVNAVEYQTLPQNREPIANLG